MANYNINYNNTNSNTNHHHHQQHHNTSNENINSVNTTNSTNATTLAANATSTEPPLATLSTADDDTNSKLKQQHPQQPNTNLNGKKLFATQTSAPTPIVEEYVATSVDTATPPLNFLNTSNSTDHCDMTSLEILNKCHLDLFPKKDIVCDDVNCMSVVEQLPILNGEYIQFIGESKKTKNNKKTKRLFYRKSGSFGHT